MSKEHLDLKMDFMFKQLFAIRAENVLQLIAFEALMDER
jgi:hypothetical protein